MIFSELLLQRQHLMANIALADNKAMDLYKNYAQIEGLQGLYLTVVSPRLSLDLVEGAPIGYAVFKAEPTEEDVRYECNVLSAIATAKSTALSEMVSIIDDYVVLISRQKNRTSSFLK